MATNDDISFPLLKKLGYLNKDAIRIKDRKRVEDRLGQLIEGGFKTLQLVADFDNTLSRFHLNGHQCSSSWGILATSSIMAQSYRDEVLRLYTKYYPIEIDPFMKEEDKLPYVIDWYSQIRELVTKHSVRKDALEGMVQKSDCHLRDRTKDFLDTLKEKDVPVLILSAGMGNIVEQVLVHFGIDTKNIKIISNFIKYNNEGSMVGFTGEMIHLYNKNAKSVHSSNYYDVVKERTNVILLGDCLGDIKMTDGVPGHSNILKIGFLNDKIAERLEGYLEAFDIVLLDDQTMDVVNSIILELK